MSGRWLVVGCRLSVAAMLAAAVSCRTTVPGTAIAPIVASSPEQARSALQERLDRFSGARSLMRVRVTSGEQAQSFRVQLVVPTRDEMELIVYTPVGTVAATVRAKGTEITSDVQAEAKQAITSWLSVAGSTPAETALLILGLPAPSGAVYETGLAGLKSATLADATFTFDPPRFPPSRVQIRKGNDVVEIEHQEIVTTP